jgi:putative Mg2+ transporter-C (MgtC) family protein
MRYGHPMPTIETLHSYWAEPLVAVNVIVFLNLAGALLLGMLVGYERSFHGRAAGMRTYGLVCMASAALTVITGYSSAWFGGNHPSAAGVDPTRVIQGIVTGIGFLCAGLIMREGFKISGLTTAASLWASSVVGILVGIGFYPSAIMLALLSAICMAWITKLQDWLPSRQAVVVTMKFNRHFVPSELTLREAANSRGYDVSGGSISISVENSEQKWSFVAVARNRPKMSPLSELAHGISQIGGINSYSVAYANN